jgi:hypothetical protein
VLAIQRHPPQMSDEPVLARLVLATGSRLVWRMPRRIVG